MVNFLGNVTSKVDDKGRIVFPAVFKNAMLASGKTDMRLLIKKGLYDRCLEVYTFDAWERQSEEIRSRLNPLNRSHAALWRKYTDGCVEVTPDERLGRISIPRKLLEEIGVTKDVEFAGMGYKIEIWDPSERKQALLSNEEFEAIANQLSV
jgi:MraZ protein